MYLFRLLLDKLYAEVPVLSMSNASASLVSASVKSTLAKAVPSPAAAPTATAFPALATATTFPALAAATAAAAMEDKAPVKWLVLVISRQPVIPS